MLPCPAHNYKSTQNILTLLTADALKGESHSSAHLGAFIATGSNLALNNHYVLESTEEEGCAWVAAGTEEAVRPSGVYPGMPTSRRL